MRAKAAERTARLQSLDAELVAHGLPPFNRLNYQQRAIMFACGDFGDVMRTMQANALLSDATIQQAVAVLVRALFVFSDFLCMSLKNFFFKQEAHEGKLRAQAAERTARLQCLDAELAANGLPPFNSLDYKQQGCMYACGEFSGAMRMMQVTALLSDATIQLAVATLVSFLQ